MVRSSSKLDNALGHGSSLQRIHYLTANEASSFKEGALDEHASGPTLAIGCSGHSDSSPVNCKQSVPAGFIRLFYEMGRSHSPAGSDCPTNHRRACQDFLCVWICRRSCTLIKAGTLKALLCGRPWKLLALPSLTQQPITYQGDGMVEHMNRSLLQMFHCFVEKQHDWGRYLPLVMFAYRTAVDTSTRVIIFPHV